MLISPAHAQAGGAPGAFDFISLIPLILIFVVFYFLLIRPQQQKARRHRELIEAIRKGDTVLTGGGIVGHVVRIEDESTLLVEIAKDVRVRVARATIADVMDRPAPAGAARDDARADAPARERAPGGRRGGKRRRAAPDTSSETAPDTSSETAPDGAPDTVPDGAPDGAGDEPERADAGDEPESADARDEPERAGARDEPGRAGARGDAG